MKAKTYWDNITSQERTYLYIHSGEITINTKPYILSCYGKRLWRNTDHNKIATIFYHKLWRKTKVIVYNPLH